MESIWKMGVSIISSPELSSKETPITLKFPEHIVKTLGMKMRLKKNVTFPIISSLKIDLSLN